MDVGELRNLGQGALDGALRRLVHDDVEDGAFRGGRLDEPCHRDLVSCEALRHVREHARPVVDLQVDVER